MITWGFMPEDGGHLVSVTADTEEEARDKLSAGRWTYVFGPLEVAPGTNQMKLTPAIRRMRARKGVGGTREFWDRHAGQDR